MAGRVDRQATGPIIWRAGLAGSNGGWDEATPPRHWEYGCCYAGERDFTPSDFTPVVRKPPALPRLRDRGESKSSRLGRSPAECFSQRRDRLRNAVA